MKVSVFTLCDFAKAEGDRMTIVGTFDTVFAHQAPAIHPMCASLPFAKRRDCNRSQMILFSEEPTFRKAIKWGTPYHRSSCVRSGKR